jgi:hypothetical protein
MSEHDPGMTAYGRKILREAVAREAGEYTGEEELDGPEASATIGEIQELYGQHSAGILNRLHDRYDEIARSKPDTSEGTYFERLSDEQKQAAIREQSRALANQARRSKREVRRIGA